MFRWRNCRFYKVSRFSQESQCEVKQGESSTLLNDKTLPGRYFVSHTLTWDIIVGVFSILSTSVHHVVEKGVYCCSIFVFNPNGPSYDCVREDKGSSTVLLVFSS